ncbi:ATP-binding protein [Maridesulfovibrio sp.]|uniref:sensor histidine kinase n=1 Tax=Maridesulfovibrio sp. TaxID=2795000 RepID=UPI0039F01810
MDNLPTLKKFGEQLDLLKQLIKDGRAEDADSIAQSMYENYAYAREGYLSQEDELLDRRGDIEEKDERIFLLEGKLREACSIYNSDLQLFGKFCKALHHVNNFKSMADLPEMLQGIAADLELGRIAVVLDRELCEGIACPDVPTFYLKGCMRYIDATLNDAPNRVFLGPISRMMRPDIFFGDPEVGPELGGSCFSFGLTDKYNSGQLMGLFSIHDPSDERFHPDMGTDFLEYFCNSVGSTLIDVLNHQRGELLRADVERITRHDLKTPLNAVINLPHLLLADEDDPEKIELIKNIQDAGYRMLGLVNRSYDIYRMESGTYELQPGDVDVLPLLKRIELDLLDMVEARSSELQVFIDGNRAGNGDSFLVRGEELLLFSMLSNLVKNSLEACPAGTPVTVRLFSGDFPVLAVHNLGVVPDSVRNNFFDKYSTAGKTGGTGLGTYSASLIARAHGGSIRMESSEDEGTTVTVDFDPESARGCDGKFKDEF